MKRISILGFILLYICFPTYGQASGCNWRNVEYGAIGTEFENLTLHGFFQCSSVGTDSSECIFKTIDKSKTLRMPTYSTIENKYLPIQNVAFYIHAKSYKATSWYPDCNSPGSDGVLTTFEYAGQSFNHFAEIR